MKLAKACAILLFLSFLSLDPLGAAQADRIVLSKTFSLEIPSELNAAFMPMPSFDGFWLQGEHSGKKFSAWIQRKVPTVIANPVSVQRLWSYGIDYAYRVGETSQDSGCGPRQKYVYQCQRLARQGSDRYAAETMIWNAESDLVIVHVFSETSYDEAAEVSKMIQFHPVAILKGVQTAHKDLEPLLREPASERQWPKYR